MIGVVESLVVEDNSVSSRAVGIQLPEEIQRQNSQIQSILQVAQSLMWSTVDIPTHYVVPLFVRTSS